jgi:HPt (histidine-containing phosphotransfer) domain-containing protein
MGREVLDLNEFLERVQHDKALLLELLDIFVEDFREKRQQTEEAVKNNDCEQIKRISHALKGSSGNISAKPLRGVLLQLEEKGKKGDLTGAGGILAEMDKEFEELTAYIATLKEELK